MNPMLLFAKKAIFPTLPVAGVRCYPNMTLNPAKVGTPLLNACTFSSNLGTLLFKAGALHTNVGTLRTNACTPYTNVENSSCFSRFFFGCILSILTVFVSSYFRIRQTLCILPYTYFHQIIITSVLILKNMKTKNVLTIIALFAIVSVSLAQSKIYKGWSDSFTDCIYTIEKGKVYKGGSVNSSNCVYTVKYSKIYNGMSDSFTDCIYTVMGDKVYKGGAVSSTNCVYTIKEGRVYKGGSTSSTDCIYTIKGNRVYKGWSDSSTDCIATTSGKIENWQIACLIGALQ